VQSEGTCNNKEVHKYKGKQEKRRP